MLEGISDVGPSHLVREGVLGTSQRPSAASAGSARPQSPNGECHPASCARAVQRGWARTQRNERCPSRPLIGPADPAYSEGEGRQGKSDSDASGTTDFGE